MKTTYISRICEALTGAEIMRAEFATITEAVQFSIENDVQGRQTYVDIIRSGAYEIRSAETD